MSVVTIKEEEHRRREEEEMRSEKSNKRTKESSAVIKYRFGSYKAMVLHIHRLKDQLTSAHG